MRHMVNNQPTAPSQAHQTSAHNNCYEQQTFEDRQSRRTATGRRARAKSHRENKINNELNRMTIYLWTVRNAGDTLAQSQHHFAERAREAGPESKIEDSHSDRRKFDVYRKNADHRLVAFGLFAGWGDHKSLFRQSCTPDEAYLEEAQQYYGWAALFCARMPDRYSGLGCALEKIAADFETYLSVLSHMGTHYFQLLARLSPGQMYHFERQAHLAALPAIEEQVLDRMLDAYGDWKAEPTKQKREVFREECSRYQLLNPDFQPDALLDAAGTAVDGGENNALLER